MTWSRWSLVSALRAEPDFSAAQFQTDPLPNCRERLRPRAPRTTWRLLCRPSSIPSANPIASGRAGVEDREMRDAFETPTQPGARDPADPIRSSVPSGSPKTCAQSRRTGGPPAPPPSRRQLRTDAACWVLCIHIRREAGAVDSDAARGGLWSARSRDRVSPRHLRGNPRRCRFHAHASSSRGNRPYVSRLQAPDRR
jgi:hypothetical protein